MLSINNINELISKQEVNNTSSLVITPPPSTNNLLITINALTSTVTSPGTEFAIVQTAGSNGVFNTSGYTSAAKFSPTTTNGWSNIAIGSGLPITADYSSNSELFNGYAYIMNLNSNTQTPFSTGNATAVASTGIFYVTTTGLSPTSAATIIRIKMVAGNLNTGTISIYSLL